MPRRPPPLSPDDGPEARFAIALRKLKDEAGFDAPTISVIAAKSWIPRSTLYAVMGGKRIPTIPVLAALVRAWNGDEAEWLTRRSDTEAELEVLRREAAVQTVTHKSASGQTDERVAEYDVPRLGTERSSRVKYGYLADPVTIMEKKYRDRPTADLVGLLERSPTGYVPRDLEVLWRLLRQRAGAPTIRTMADGVGWRHQRVAYVLQGKLPDYKDTRPLLDFLLARIPADPAESSE